MAAYAEGLSILHNANVGKGDHSAADAETTPLRDPRALPVRHEPARYRRGPGAAAA